MRNKTGALEGIEIYEPESFRVFENNGDTHHFYQYFELLKTSWPEIATQDENVIKEFCTDIIKLQNLSSFPENLLSCKAGKEVIKAVETHFPHMQGKLTPLDVVTPQTYQKYCNAYRGAFMAFWP